MRSATLLTLTVVVAAPSTGFAQAATSNPAADAAFARSDWATALAGYLELVKRDSVSPSPWFRMGVSYHNLGRFRDAATALARASALGASPYPAHLALAAAYARAGDAERALAHLDTASRNAGPGAIPAAVRGNADLATIRTHPRYTAALNRIEAGRYPCRSSAEARQLDFWIGKWDVTLWNAPAGSPANAAGVNDVHAILEQCVLLENWRAAGGGEGKSMNFYDTNSRKWRQIWVADGGGSLDYSGEFRDGAMRFEGWTRGPQGGRVMQKLTFTPYGLDTVRQTFEASSDSGKTWTVTFDARYVRQKR